MPSQFDGIEGEKLSQDSIKIVRKKVKFSVVNAEKKSRVSHYRGREKTPSQEAKAPFNEALYGNNNAAKNIYPN